MPTSQTPNYQLNQWSRDDRILMEDFNADNAKIDAAIAGHEGRVAALEQRAPHWGNCQIYTTTYKGTGDYTSNFGEGSPNSLTFPKKPVWAIIFRPDGRQELNLFPEDIDYTTSTPSTDFKVHIEWKGNTVFWYASDIFLQMNWFGYTYRVIAFWPMD